MKRMGWGVFENLCYSDSNSTILDIISIFQQQ